MLVNDAQQAQYPGVSLLLHTISITPLLNLETT